MKKRNLAIPLLVAALGFGWPHFSKVAATEKLPETVAEQKDSVEKEPAAIEPEEEKKPKGKTKPRPPSKVDALLKQSSEKSSHYRKF